MEQQRKRWNGNEAHSDELESSNEMNGWGKLPEDLQEFLLSHLPAGEILRLRAVSKQWCSLSSSPRFRSMWADNNNRSSSFFVLSLHSGELAELETCPPILESFPSSIVRFHRCSSGDLGKPLSQLKLASFISGFPEEGMELLHAAGGLLLGVTRSCFWVGNPVTHEWVRVPPLKSRSIERELLPYMSDGKMFFKVWIDPFLFDSKLGIWTLPQRQRMPLTMCSHNTLHLGGITYALAHSTKHQALVLLALEPDAGEFSSLSETSTWVHAWNAEEYSFYRTYLLEIDGKIGIIAQPDGVLVDKLVVLVLGSQNAGWEKVAELPFYLESFIPGACCTHGKLTFVSNGERVVVFDSGTLRWELLEDSSRSDDKLLILEPSISASPGLNVPCEARSKMCASRKYARYLVPVPFKRGSFSELSESRMSWRDIGRQEVDRVLCKVEPLKEGVQVVNKMPWSVQED